MDILPAAHTSHSTHASHTSHTAHATHVREGGTATTREYVRRV